MTDEQDIKEILQHQREFFLSGKTRSVNFRKEQLRQLRKMLKDNESEVFSALKADLNRCQSESFIGELAPLYDEIDYAMDHLKEWVAPERVRTPKWALPGKSYIQREPKGCVLIIAPWNYPIQLALSPLVAALAAGNCVIIKPSEHAEASARFLADRMPKYFSQDLVKVVCGGVTVGQQLLQQKFDHIFATGSSNLGRIVMSEAAKQLIPVTLELGGKSPCIFDESADWQTAVRRLVWAKYFNAGQTCVAPDFVCLPHDNLQEFLSLVRTEIVAQYGRADQMNGDFSQIINEEHFERLKSLIDNQEVWYGGLYRREQNYISPTVLSPVNWEDPVMEDEIFGPLLPVLTYRDEAELMQRLRSLTTPLALYLFSTNKAFQQKFIQGLSFGGGCVNDCMIHLGNPELPFGGKGASGMGAYHGRYGFEELSHKKSVVYRGFRMDFPLRYPPYGARSLRWLRRLMRWAS